MEHKAGISSPVLLELMLRFLAAEVDATRALAAMRAKTNGICGLPQSSMVSST